MIMSKLQINATYHICGDARCEECLFGYPRKCRCGGLVHAEHVVSDVAKGGSGFKYLCDKCHDKFLKQPYQQDLRRKPRNKNERKKK
jgi:hypothetical protein